METLIMMVCLVSATYPDIPEFCATQKILVVSEDKPGDYCDFKQKLIDENLEAGDPYEPLMTTCKIYVPEEDEDRINVFEGETE